jgi:Bardet-Biedl syndrome 1 protein
MYQTFQQELFKFRLRAAREFLKSLTNSLTPISTNPNEPLKLNAQVQGIGPTFKLVVKVQNISSTAPVYNLFITFTYDENLYKLSKTYLEVSEPNYEYK